MIDLKRLVVAALAFFSLSAVQAASMVLVYDSSAAVANGKATPAPVSDAGVLLPADSTLPRIGTILIGDADGLYQSVLFRLDNDLNIAVVRRGEPVKDPQLLGHHLHRWAGAQAFVAGGAAPAVSSTPATSASASTEPFHVTINGVSADSTVVLKERFNKAKFQVSVVNASTAPAWAISVKVTSDPKLAFWKEGRRSGLNEVPEPALTYDRQFILKPLSPGESVSVSAEAYYMKGKDYTWTVQAKTRAITSETKFAVRIE